MEQLEREGRRENGTGEYQRLAYQTVREILETLPEQTQDGTANGVRLAFAARLYAENFGHEVFRVAGREQGELTGLLARARLVGGTPPERTALTIATAHPAYAPSLRLAEAARPSPESLAQQRRGAARELIARLPINGREITGRDSIVTQALEAARGRLQGEPPLSEAVREGIIRPDRLNTFLAGEILDQLARFGHELREPGQLSLLAAYRDTVRQLRARPLEVGGRALVGDETGKVQAFAEILGVGSTVSRTGRWAIEPGREDAALDRLRFLLQDAQLQAGTGSFDATMGRVLDGMADYIAERATPEQIAKAQFIYRRWRIAKVRQENSPLNRGGNNQGADTFVFTDPTGRLRLVHTKFGSPEYEIEVAKIVRDEEGRFSFDPEHSFYVVRADGKEKRGNREANCMMCHAVSARTGAYFTEYNSLAFNGRCHRNTG